MILFDALPYAKPSLYIESGSSTLTKKTQPMKRFLHLYKQHPVLALIVNSIAFFVWAFTIIMIITIMAVAFAG